jgi:hypothetical protein
MVFTVVLLEVATVEVGVDGVGAVGEPLARTDVSVPLTPRGDNALPG